MQPIPIDPRRPHQPWGLIHPAETGIEWQVKCGGIQVRYIRVEGVFFPLLRPIRNDRDLLIELQHAEQDESLGQYSEDRLAHQDIWSEIMEALGFEFQVVSPPAAEELGDRPTTVPQNQVGLLWIEITAVTNQNHGWLKDLPEPLILVPGNTD
jgi:hypothetical protein